MRLDPHSEHSGVLLWLCMCAYAQLASFLVSWRCLACKWDRRCLYAHYCLTDQAVACLCSCTVFQSEGGADACFPPKQSIAAFSRGAVEECGEWVCAFTWCCSSLKYVSFPLIATAFVARCAEHTCWCCCCCQLYCTTGYRNRSEVGLHVQGWSVVAIGWWQRPVAALCRLACSHSSCV